MVLESPFYGRRRPAWQPGSRLLRVSDLLVLGRATIEESLCLLEWARGQDFGKLGESATLEFLATSLWGLHFRASLMSQPPYSPLLQVLVAISQDSQ